MSVLSKTRFRGPVKANIQFLLTATALNLKKMVKMLKNEAKEISICRRICSFIKLIEDFFNYYLKKLIFQEA
jgi:glycerol-3-phosphate responsive antiterminator